MKITIRIFNEVQAAVKLNTEDTIDREIKILSIVTGKPESYFYEMSIERLKRKIRKTARRLTRFRQHVPSFFFLAGRLYKVQKDITRITAGQYIDIKTLNTDNVFENIHVLCAILCRPVTERKYKGELVPERAKLFYERLSINIAYPLMVFFFRLFTLSSLIILQSLHREMTTESEGESSRQA